MLSDVECSTRKAGSKGRCLGRSRMTLVGSTSIWFGCLMRCTNGRIRLKIKMKESCRSSLVIFFVGFASKATAAIRVKLCSACVMCEVGEGQQR